MKLMAILALSPFTTTKFSVSNQAKLGNVGFSIKKAGTGAKEQFKNQ